MIRMLAAVMAAFLLAGCAWDYGVTHVKASFTPDGKVRSFDWGTGTEKSYVSVKANMTTGAVEYTARDVLAFDGQRIAGEIHKGLVDAGVSVSEAVVRGVVTGVLGTGAIEGAGAVVRGSAAIEAARTKAAAAASAKAVSP